MPAPQRKLDGYDYPAALLLVWGVILVARSLDSRSIYDARLSDVEMQERPRRRETRASA